ncbi:MAG: hypothetical protein KDA89_09105 [Planctomycetaceae bacterium]|nr:hypothetical protein [Planctomycetaceae bacterium]
MIISPKLLFPLTALLLCCSVDVVGEVVAGEEEHQHTPLVVRSRPVIERLPARVVDPCDVALTLHGDTLVADRAGRLVLSIDQFGETHLVARNLNHVSRLADSPLGVHLLLNDGGSSRIVRCLDNGVIGDVAHLPFDAVGFGADIVGNLLTADRRSGQIWRIHSDGQPEVIGQVTEPVKDVAVDASGNAVVLLQSGRIETMQTDGGSVVAGYVSREATRIRIHPQRFVVALVPDPGHRAALMRPTENRDDDELRYAVVPAGTQAFAFDTLGNLTLASTDLRAVTRVTSCFRVPCPHCGQQIPMTLSPDAPPTEPAGRSF